MRRLLVLSLLLVLAAPLAAGQRMRTASRMPPAPALDGAFVSGLVATASATRLTLAEGVIALDITAARIVDAKGEERPATGIEPGTRVHALLEGTEPAADGSLRARLVAVAPESDVTLSGPVGAVDLHASTFTLLGSTVRVTPATSFGGGFGGEVAGLGDLAAGQLVVVQADVAGGVLSAVSVLSMPSPGARPEMLVGTVRSIGPDSWTIAKEDGGETVVLIDARTRIVGAPKVGDRVTILATRGSAGLVALAIAPMPAVSGPGLPIPQLLRGVVKSIGTDWTIALDEGGDTTVRTSRRTVVIGNPQVGDHVEIVAVEMGGVMTAQLIVKK